VATAETKQGGLTASPLDEDAAVALADQLKALADPVRLRLVSLLATSPTGELCACELPDLLGRSQPTISHHLSQLHDVGLIEREQRGKWAWFRLTPGGLGRIRAALGEGVVPQRTRKPIVLFACIHNAGRSQMAAALMAEAVGDVVEVRSGGSAPAKTVNPAAVAAMAEIGIDLASVRPRKWTSSGVAAADVVVTMGCGDECPVVPGKRRLDWPIDDPAGQPVEVVRRIRDDIAARVRVLANELTSPCC
jgi:arsenate reductase (thioredoxin)